MGVEVAGDEVPRELVGGDYVEGERDSGGPVAVLIDIEDCCGAVGEVGAGDL